MMGDVPIVQSFQVTFRRGVYCTIVGDHLVSISRMIAVGKISELEILVCAWTKTGFIMKSSQFVPACSHGQENMTTHLESQAV